MTEFIQEALTLIALAIFIGICQSVGQGGGPIINVCLMVGFSYTTNQAINYSYVIILGASVSSIIQNWIKQSGKKQSLVDFDLILITLPMMLSGSIIGVVLKQFLSQLTKTIFLTFLLGLLILKTLKNYQKSIEVDNQYEIPYDQIDQNGNQQNETPYIDQKQINNTYQQKPNQQKCANILTIILIVGYTVIIELIRGSRKFISIFGYEPCKLEYWIFNLIHIFLSFIISMSITSKNQDPKKQQLKLVKNSNSIHFIATGLFAGIAGGALGIGGATVLVPCWLSLGLQAHKVVSNSIPLVLTTSLSLFFLALISKSYSWILLICFLSLSFVASFIIQKLVNQIIKKYRIKSAIYIILIFILILSLAVLLPYQIQKYNQNPVTFLKFGEFC